MNTGRNDTVNKILVSLTLLFTMVYLVWRIGWTIPNDKGTLSIIFWIILILAEGFGLLEMAVHFFNMYNYTGKNPNRPELDSRKFPDVDIFIPTYNEPDSVVEKTVIACKKMKYPNTKQVHIYVCDDGRRESIKALTQKHEVGYITRDNNDFAKAGNLNNALKQTNSEFIVVFDSDMMPRKDFLMETIPYFAPNILMLDKSKKKKVVRNDGKGLVGFVQTPQGFYEPDIFQYNLFSEKKIPNEQDYFYRVIQIAKNKTNSVVFGGSNTVLARVALEQAGGFVTGAITEDFATGIEIEKKGFTCLAINKVLASGMPAKTMKSFVTQRRRWARGCIQSGKITKYLKSDSLSFAQKINYLTSISYWYGPIKRFIYLMAPVLFALFGIVVVECTLKQVLMFWLPMYILTNICISRFSENIRTNKWTNIYDMVLFPYLIGSVIKESFGFTEKKFKVTRKEDETKSSSFLYMLPFLIIIGIIVASLVCLVNQSISENTYSYLVILFWLAINLYYALMAMFVAWGRNIRLADSLTITELAASIVEVGVNPADVNQAGTTKIVGINTSYVSLDNEKLANKLLLEVNTDNNEALSIIIEREDKNIYKILWNESSSNLSDLVGYVYDQNAHLPQRLMKRGFYVDEIVTNLVEHIIN